MTDLIVRIAQVIHQHCHGVYMDDAADAAAAIVEETGRRLRPGAEGSHHRQVALSMSDLTERIAQVLIAHPDRMDGKCHGTGKPFEHQDEWAAHVAAAIVEELECVTR